MVRKTVVDTTLSAIITNPEQFPPEATTPNKDDIRAGIYPLRIYEGHNYLPTDYGYKSFFGHSPSEEVEIEESLAPQHHFVYQTEFYSNVHVSLTRNGIYLNGSLCLSLDPPDTDTDYLWTIATIQNIVFMYRQSGQEVFILNEGLEGDPSVKNKWFEGLAATLEDKGSKISLVGTEQIGISSFTPTFLNMQGQVGIFRIQGALGFWDVEDAVAWSALQDFTDFTPSLTTLANIVNLENIRGRITLIAEHGDGAIVYATNSIVGITNTTDALLRFQSIPILQAAGVAYPKEVAVASPSTQHFAYTSAGFMHIANMQVAPIIPALTDFLRPTRTPQYLSFINNRYLCINVMAAGFLEGQVEFSTQDTSRYETGWEGSYLPRSEVPGYYIPGQEVCLSLESATVEEQPTIIYAPALVLPYQALYLEYQADILLNVVQRIDYGESNEQLRVPALYGRSEVRRASESRPVIIRLDSVEANVTEFIHNQNKHLWWQHCAEIAKALNATREAHNLKTQWAGTTSSWLVNHFNTEGLNNSITESHIWSYQQIVSFQRKIDAGDYKELEVNHISSLRAALCQSTIDRDGFFSTAVCGTSNPLISELHGLSSAGLVSNAVGNPTWRNINRVGTLSGRSLSADLATVPQSFISPSSLRSTSEQSVITTEEIYDYLLDTGSSGLYVDLYQMVEYNRNSPDLIGAVRIINPTMGFLVAFYIEDEWRVRSYPNGTSPSYQTIATYETEEEVYSAYPNAVTPYGGTGPIWLNPQQAQYEVLIVKNRPIYAYIDDTSTYYDASAYEDTYFATLTPANPSIPADLELTTTGDYKATPSIVPRGEKSIWWFGRIYTYAHFLGITRNPYQLDKAYLITAQRRTRESASFEWAEYGIYGIKAEYEGWMLEDGSVEAHRWLYVNTEITNELLQEHLGKRLKTYSARYEAANQQLVCGIAKPIDIPATTIEPIIYEGWEIEGPPLTWTLHNGNKAPVSPTFYGAYIYDIYLEKWGVYKAVHGGLIDYQAVGNYSPGLVPYSNFLIEAGALIQISSTWVPCLFTNTPQDSYIKYGKYQHIGANYTTIEEVEITFSYESKGVVGLTFSLDGRNPEYGHSVFVPFTDQTIVAFGSDLVGRWASLTVSGVYDISSIRITSNEVGDR